MSALDRLAAYSAAVDKVRGALHAYSAALVACPCTDEREADPCCDVGYAASRLWTAEQDMLAARADTR